MKLETPKNPNYAAVVVALSNFVDLAGCNNVKAALIFGNSVIVGKDAKEGDLGLFFPVETQLMREFLANNNLYRKPEWGNIDPEKKGFFEEHGRVKAVKFRGHKSEGFWIPINCLNYLVQQGDWDGRLLVPGAEFDGINDHPICKKYVPRQNSVVGTGRKDARQPRMEDKIVEGQFRFHLDTENLRRNIHKILPDMWISISDKWHGTSAVIANILVKRELRWYERLAKRLGIAVKEEDYGLTWSSRRVVKGVDDQEKLTAIHFYTEDIWGTVARKIGPLLPKGVTVYGEIVGYTNDASPIQKGYHYGCSAGQHRFLVYRVTYTNPEGRAFEFSWQQMKEFCAKYGLEMVNELWYGQAKNVGGVDLLELAYCGSLEAWQNELLKTLEHKYVNDQMCPHNNNEVPAEGIVLRVDRLESCESYKLKNFKFLEWETKQLDKGEVDLETQEAEAV